MMKTWRVKRNLLYNNKLSWFILSFAAAEQNLLMGMQNDFCSFYVLW